MAGNEIFNDINLVLQLNQHIQGVTVTPESVRVLTPGSTSSPLAKRTSFKVLTDLESVSYKDPREDAQFDHQRSVFFSLCSSDLPFHLQGDREFNEASAMAKRRALRFSEAIKTRIEFLWEVAGSKKQAEIAQRIRQQQQEQQEQGRARRSEPSVRRAGVVNGIRPMLPTLEELDEEDYMALMLLIFKVLRDDFVLELAHKQIQCDWEVDSHHGKTITFDQFFAAVFELVDVWTCDVEETTYVRFLDLLARRITRRVAVFLDGAELKLSLSDNSHPDVVVKSIPLRTIPKFVSVARVVAAAGISTVGELARADPKVVEQERVDFLQRNNGGAIPAGIGEINKIGQDLQTLLAMFKSIASQYEHINYTLDNNVLRKLPSTAGSRPDRSGTTGGAGDMVYETNENNVSQEKRGLGRVATNEEATGNEQPNGYVSDIVSGSGTPVARGGSQYSLSSRHRFNAQMPAGAVANTTTNESYTQYSGAVQDNTSVGPLVRDSNMAYDFRANGEYARPGYRSTTMIYEKHCALSPKTRAQGASDGCVNNCQPLNTIYDLQLADASVVDTLRSTFLIEKAICIERQTEIESIRAELTKFSAGINVVELSVEVARDRYNALYDMLVLRDGESLKTLAGVMLEQIKLLLTAHGIIVEDEEDMEEVYNGFVASVVNGTGDSIVQEAQRWMEGTVQDNKVSNYIQHDFHELKSIDEVKLFGTKAGDEEFLALLAKDTDVIDEEGDDSKRPVGRKNSSPIQRKPSRAIIPPSSSIISRSLDTDQIRPPGPVEESLPRPSAEQTVTSAKDDAGSCASDKKKKAKKKKNGQDKSSHSSSSTPTPIQSAGYQEGELAHSSAEGRIERSQVPSRKPKLHILIQDSAHAMETHGKEDASLGPPTDATDASIHDDGKRSRLRMTASQGRPNLGLEIDIDLEGKGGHHDTSDQHTARDALNIALEFDEHDTGPGNSEIAVIQERPISTEPKVPKIVIGGAPSANNVPVTGRYIQLLGLGTVLIMSGERELFQLLQSQDALDVDLVCYDIGTELDTALTKLHAIQRRVGNRVILFGGNVDEPEMTQRVALDCLADGALYFASIPFDFPRLREKIMTFFENSKQPYILRQRKPPGQTAHVGTSIGSGSLFALHDEPRKASMSVAYARTPRRKVAATIPALPSLPQSPRESSQPQSLPQVLSESRRAEFTPIAPGTPRSSQSSTRPPRFSSSLNKLIR